MVQLSSLRPTGRGGFIAASVVLADGISEELMRDADYLAAMKQIADEGAEYAQNLAPIGETGNLRDSIISKGATLEGDVAVGLIEVGDGASYWAFVEYGTGQRGSASEQPDPGVAEGYSHGPSTGMEAQPYMRPTLWYLRQRIGF